MKKLIIKFQIVFTVISFTILFVSCEDYLAKTDSASVPESDVFGTFKSYQGFVANMYNYIFDNINITGNPNTQWTAFDEAVVDVSYQTEYLMEVGSYKIDLLDNAQNQLRPARLSEGGITSTNNLGRRSMWDMPWYCIRMANIALEKLPLLKEATDDERDVIKGQAYFFRAYSHFDLIKVWGGLPYIDKALQPDDDMKFPRLNYFEATEKIVADLDSAIKYLPVDWDKHPAGAKSIGINSRLATKGAAMAYKAKALLYAGSPLMNGTVTGNYSYNQDYCKRAADAAWQVIELANQGVYRLLPWSNYSDNFYKVDNTYPGQMSSGAPELIFEDPQPIANNGVGRAQLFSLISIGYLAAFESPTQNIVDRFEKIDGKKIPSYIPTESNYDPTFDPTSTTGRDPRMDKALLTDREIIIENPIHAGRVEATAQLYSSPLGADRAGLGQVGGYSESGYGIQKFVPRRYNKFDDKNTSAAMAKFRYIIPNMRLAEVYLIYAEAANEAYGPKNTPTTTPGMITAEAAVNIVRLRVDGMAMVANEYTANKEIFRERIWNERSAELCFEGHRWFDVRRWYIAHLEPNKKQYGLNFDKNHSYFIPYNIKPIIFNLRDYWLPLPTSQISIYKELYQNPGW